jgi:transcriptional regulator
MYCPNSFKEDSPERIRELIKAYPLATVITRNGGDLVADHLPLMCETDSFGNQVLIGHVAKGNPIWKTDPSQELLVIFHGPDAYISPNWYATKSETGKVVPTWNYAVVHVYGTLTAIESPEKTLEIITKLTEIHESKQPVPWRLSDAPEDYTRSLLNAIVGIQISMLRVQGKWKTSQNQPVCNQQTVVTGLEKSGARDAQDMSNIIKKQIS